MNVEALILNHCELLTEVAASVDDMDVLEMRLWIQLQANAITYLLAREKRRLEPEV